MNDLENRMAAISCSDVEDKINRIRASLGRQQKGILAEFTSRYDQVLTKKKNRYTCPVEYLEADLQKFLKAMTHIVNSFFPIMMQDFYICSASEDAITAQVEELKNTLSKSWNSLYRKLVRQDDTAIIGSDTEDTPEKKIKKARKSGIRRRGKNCKLPVDAATVMQRWLLENFKQPYPSHAKKEEMARCASISVQQVSNWFINARQRIIKKYVVRARSRKELSHRERAKQEEDSDEL